MTDRALIIDGNAIMYRAYYATQRDRNEEEQEKHFGETIVSLSSTAKKALSKGDYKYAVVAFDTSRKTFRSAKFEEYKATRPSMPKALLNHLPDVKKAFERLGFKEVRAPENYEGDDVIATISTLFSSNNINVDVISTDRDLLQLVSKHITVTLLKTGGKQQVHNFDNFKEMNEGLLPNQIPLYKALAGDGSDNYKGVEGIGEKTAVNLLLRYENIDGIYEHLDELKPKQRESLTKSKAKVQLFLELALLVKNLDLSRDLKDYENSNRFGKPW